MQNLFTRAKAAHQAQDLNAVQQRENARREAAKQREARRFMAQHIAADYVANVLGERPLTETILVSFESGNSTIVMEVNFSWQGGEWSVSFSRDLFDICDLNRAETVAGRRAGLELFFLAPDGWFHVSSLEKLGERLSRPDCAEMGAKTEAHDE